MNTTNALHETEVSLTKVQTFDASRLARNKELGDYLNFEEAVPYAERLIALYKKLPVSALKDLPDSAIATVKQYSDTVNNLFVEIFSFKPDESNSNNNRSSLIGTLRDFFQESFNALSPIIAYATLSETDIDKLKKETQRIIDYHNDKINEQLHTIDDLKNTVKELNEVTRGIASGKGTDYHANCFIEQAKDNNRSSWFWLAVTFTSCAATILYAKHLIDTYKKDELIDIQLFQYISQTTPKLIIITILVFSIGFAAKNYFACKHNFSTNRHRHNALITYTAIAAGAKTNAQADAIVGQASACIFSHQATGYASSNDNQCGPTLSPVTQMLLDSTVAKPPNGH